MDLSNKIKAAAEYIKGKSKYNPTIGLILGSGLGAIADQIEDAEYFPYNEIPNFPVSTVEGHAGRLVIGKFQGKEVVAMQGRFHYYEGYSMQEVTCPDMSNAYDKDLRAQVKDIAKNLGIEVREGVYAMFSGPTYETPAEVRMARILGADAVGMSTVPEVIIANHSGMKVIGVSCMTNMAAGILEQPLNHEEVMETSAKVRKTFIELMTNIIKEI